MQIQEKKSAVDLTDLAIGIVVLGIVVSVGAYILITARDSRLTDLQVLTTTNEKLTSVTGAGKQLANTWVKSVINATNSTDGTLIPSTNYSVSISQQSGKATIIATNGGFNNTNWNVTYQYYNTSRPDWALPNSATTGIGEFGNWFVILTIVGVAAVVLSLIFMAFKSDSTKY